MNTVANTADIFAITDMKFVAYGNTKKNADGSFTCQHGADECTGDVIGSCLQYKLDGNISAISNGKRSKEAWPFIYCFDKQGGKPSGASTCYAQTMAATHPLLPWSVVNTCVTAEERAVQNEAMAGTPKHDYTPWTLVDGVLLSNTNLLQNAICTAYTGPKPASCRFLEGTALRSSSVW